MAFPIEGGCLCGAVRYRVLDAPVASMHCHCENCRKASGAAMLTWFTVASENFEWLAGVPKRYGYESEHYDDPIERWFCGSCGSPLVWRGRDDGTVDLTAGSLDDPNAIEPGWHVFVKGQISWLHVEDDLPKHDTRPRTA